MSVLSDKEIRALCEKPVASYMFMRDLTRRNAHMPRRSEVRHLYGNLSIDEQNDIIMNQKNNEGWDTHVFVGPNENFLPMIEPYEAGQVRAIKPSLGEFDVDKQLDYIYEIVDWVKKMTGFDVMDKLHGHRNSIVRINDLMKLNHTQMDQLQLSLDRIGPQAKNTFRREDGVYRTVQEFIDHVWDNVIPQDYFEDNIADYKKIVSYGTSSYGYDVRCADEFKIFTNVNSAIIDPKNFNQRSFVEFKGKECIIPPNSFALARTVEYFRIPRDVITICLGKSTYARCGIIVNVTPFEPEWEGYVTLEFSNTTPLPAKIYANEGCAQVLFLQGNQPPLTSYKDRNGKYQGQSGVVTPRM